MDQNDHQLYPLAKSTGLLGDLSIWTLRKHISRGNVKPTRLGRRVFINGAEIARIQRDGLPSLTNAAEQPSKESIQSTAKRKNRTRVSPEGAHEPH